MKSYLEQMADYNPNEEESKKQQGQMISVANDAPETTALEEKEESLNDPMIPKYLELKTIKVDRYYLKK